MKKIIVVFLFTVIFVSIFAIDYETLYPQFAEIRSLQKKPDLVRLMSTLENAPETQEDVKLLTLLADCYREYANWATEIDKEQYYKKSRETAENAIKLDPNYGYAYYVAGAAIGQLAQYVGIIKSLFMLGDFDKYIDKAMELLPDNHFPFYAKALRYRDTPWPFKDFKKSEELFMKSINLDPSYLDTYYDLAILYDMWGKEDLATEYCQKVLEMPEDEDYVVISKEAKEKAEAWLKEKGKLE
ncbi:hypothetical protein AT15_07665 [Kosmotoga arenicorallina S304]|uniref:Uncharacterized protein n=1 Tax=Kosmotoga arenicorallina S304 TaxID=1453497 RepID=A0A182C779_9BACT|nr:tetratricopeptide repeat protein [Kosmotoga arenicorallina]OAA31365.1 hypothetical protein AT15_07665 [Kosmotoga arenicorallina S304]